MHSFAHNLKPSAFQPSTLLVPKSQNPLKIHLTNFKSLLAVSTPVIFIYHHEKNHHRHIIYS